ncbi:hypothetical protein ACF1AJ_20655 [Leifsonia sp. NPDC014704]|uniref:hypothetical protein n=1 Tax=Leifsonia sp. NPDC014704 TaxID=3364123 RepID=UPI0036F4A07F
MNKAHLTMTTRELRHIVAATLPAVSKDEVTPSLTAALFTLDAGRLTLTGTDRYRVHRVRGKYNGSKAGEFLVPRDALEWVVKNAGFFRRRSTVEPVARVDFAYELGAFKSPGGTVTITLAEHEHAGAPSLSYSLPLIQANFPPVHRLVEKALELTPEPCSGHVSLDLLADAKKIARDRHEGGNLRIVQPNPGSTKPGQMLVTFEFGEALLQLMEDPAKDSRS